MREPSGGSPKQTAAREASRRVAKTRYPCGKALARVRYFETQRGIVVAASETSGETPTRSARAVGRSAVQAKLPYAAASRAKRRAEPSFADAADLPAWRSLGPSRIPRGQTYGAGGNNRPAVSGRCVGVSIDPGDPRRIILCSAGGGLWSSGDEGATWVPLTDFHPVLSLGALARAPSAPQILYAGTGEGDTRSPLGQGLFRSSDGGRTWAHVASPELTGTGIYDLAIDPGDHMHLWIGAVSGLFESKDGGATVKRIRQGLVWSVSVNPTDTAEVLVGCDAGLLRSANGGSTWTKVALPGAPSGLDRLEVCHAPSSPKVVYVAGAVGSQAFLWRRASAGGAFSAAQPPSTMDVSQAWYDWCLAVAPDDPDVVYWGAIELYRGKRSGGTWQWSNISSRSSGDSIHPDQHHIAFDPSDPKTVYVCNDGGLFRSRNRGTAWESLNLGLDITEFEFIAHLESDASWILGGTQDNGTLSHGGAGRWDQVALGDGGDCGAVDAATPVCFHSFYGMWIERARATGAAAFDWKDVSPPAPDSYEALFYPPMDVVGTVLAKAGTSVFVSDDSGDSWEEVLLPQSGANLDLASALTIVSTKLILVGTSKGKIHRIKRAASGWSQAQVGTLASPRSGFISDIVPVGSATSGHLWASCSKINGAHVFFSSDGGATWENRSGDLPNVPVNAVVVDPDDASTVFAATDQGVYRSRDAGVTWTDFSNGLPNAVVSDLILHVQGRVLRAGTRNRGAWEVDI